MNLKSPSWEKVEHFILKSTAIPHVVFFSLESMYCLKWNCDCHCDSQWKSWHLSSELQQSILMICCYWGLSCDVLSVWNVTLHCSIVLKPWPDRGATEQSRQLAYILVLDGQMDSQVYSSFVEVAKNCSSVPVWRHAPNHTKVTNNKISFHQLDVEYPNLIVNFSFIRLNSV